MTSELRVSELLASRMCHDLAAGVGAIRNGIELVADFDEDLSAEAMDLIGMSADQAAARLQFYRMAYGEAGRRGLSTIHGVLDIARAIAESRNVTIEGDVGDPTLREGLGKLLLNMLALVFDALPRGGTVTLILASGGFRFEAAGPRAGLDTALRDTLDARYDVSKLAPATVHGFFTQQLAREVGRQVGFEQVNEDLCALFERTSPTASIP